MTLLGRKGREVLETAKRMPGVQMARLELAEAVHTMFEPLGEDVEGHTGRVTIRSEGTRARRFEFLTARASR